MIKDLLERIPRTDTILRHRWFWYCLIAIMFLSAIVYQANTHINHDVAWYLYATGQMLNGSELYKDIIEVNPPLTFFVTAIPVYLSRLFHLSPTTGYKIFIFLISFLSLLYCNIFSKKIFRHSPPTLRYLFLFLITFIFTVLPMHAFGQREHIFLILCMPYFLSVIVSVLGEKYTAKNSLMIGFFAAIGFLIKPFYLIIWLILEIFIILDKKSIRALYHRYENLLIIIISFAYLTALTVFWSRYITLTKISLQVYHAYNSPVTMILSYRIDLFLLMLVSVLFLSLQKNHPSKKIFVLLLIIAVSSFFIALFQKKGWSYHFYPYKAMILLFLTSNISHFISRIIKLDKTFRFGFNGFLLLVLTYFICFQIFIPIKNNLANPPYDKQTTQRLIDLVKKHAPNKYIFLFSTSVSPSFPLVNYTDTHWASRFNCLWFLPALYPDNYRPQRYHKKSEMNYIEQYIFTTTISDIQKNKPALIIVNTSPIKQGFKGRDFDFIRYFSQDNQFKNFINTYRKAGTVGYFDIYEPKN